MSGKKGVYRMRQVRVAQQRGAVLVIALVLLVPLTIVSSTVASRSSLNERMATNQRDGGRALSVTEGGLDQILSALQGKIHTEQYVYTALPSGKLGYGRGVQKYLNDLLAENGSGVLSNEIGLNKKLSFGDDPDTENKNESIGNFTVELIGVDPNNDWYTFRGTGKTTDDFGERSIEVIVEIDKAPDRTAPFSVLTQDALTLDVDIDVDSGDDNEYNANIHSNASISISGDSDIDGIDGIISTSESISSAVTLPDNCCTESVPSAEIPIIDPPRLKPNANYVMVNDCSIKDVSDPSFPTSVDETDPVWNGWSCDGGDWSMTDSTISGNDLTSGFFYVEGDVQIDSNAGGNWSLTIVAEGSIDVRSNINFQAFGETVLGSEVNGDDEDAQNSEPQDAADLLFVAGNDLKIDGTLVGLASDDDGEPEMQPQKFHGVMAAHGEVHIEGQNLDIQGRIIAENGSGGSGTDLVAQNFLGGTLTLLNNLRSPWNPIIVEQIAWRELID